MQATSKIQPLRRLFLFLSEDKADLLSLLVYTSISSLLNLSIPLAAQALINTIASGIFLQPLVILTLLIFLGLSFNGLIRALEVYLVEILQRRIFARISLRLARHIPKATIDAFGQNYPPEVVNRFFDTVSAQKSIAKLFLDIPNAGLQFLLSIILIGIYSPFLLGFDAIFVLAVIGIALLGYRAVKTNIEESTYKYVMAYWLQELARCQLNFKINAHNRFALLEANQKIMDYLDARKAHFSIVFRQQIAGFVLFAVANAGVLAWGGWLVLNNMLTLGQLVAAELMTLILLNSTDKMVQSLATFYTLQTSMDKLGKLFDLPEEGTGQTLFRVAPNQPTGVDLRDIYYRYPTGKTVFEALDLKVSAGAKVSVVGKSGSGKTTMALIIAGLKKSDFGNVVINGVDLRDVDLPSFRQRFSLVTNSNDLFNGSLETNIRMNRENISQDDLMWAMEIADLSTELPMLEQGLQTQLISEGKNLSEGIRQRVLIARAMVNRPALIILDEAFAGIDEVSKIRILDRLMNPEAPWTLIQMTHDLDVIARSQQVFMIKNGKISETATPWALADEEKSHFSQCFPKLATLLRQVPKSVLLSPVEG
ncbi:MAG: ATP-binding cassette domain-containing protein [Cyanobacteria bacterium P01_H01_bin.74]